MLYVKIDNLDILYTDIQLLARLRREGISAPTVLTDETLAPFGWATVETVQLTKEPGFKYAIKAKKTKSGYQRIFEKIQMTPEEIASIEAKVRARRDQLLKNDVDSINVMRWSAMTPEKQNEWTAYRQALLDIPSQEGFPFSVVWPVKPE